MASRGLLGAIDVGVQGAQRFPITFLMAPGGRGCRRRRGHGHLYCAAAGAAAGAAVAHRDRSPASKYVARGRGAHDLAQTRAVAAQIARRTVATTLLLALAAVPLLIGPDGGDLSEAACVAVFVVGYCVYSFNSGLQFGAGQAARAPGWHLISACSGLTGLLVVSWRATADLRCACR